MEEADGEPRVRRTWTKTVGILAALAGVGATFFLFHFPDEIWYLVVGGVIALLTGGLGALIGSMIDARRVRLGAVLGVIGFFVGAVAGFYVVSNAVNDSFAGGAFHGMFIGIPVGAAVGCIGGVLLGKRLV